MSANIPRRLTAEAVGTAMLLAAVVGSGTMADRLSSGNEADFRHRRVVADDLAVVQQSSETALHLVEDLLIVGSPCTEEELSGVHCRWGFELRPRAGTIPVAVQSGAPDRDVTRAAPRSEGAGQQ